LVERELAGRGAAFVRFDTDAYPERTDLSFGVGPDGERVGLEVGGKALDGHAVGAVYWRHLRSPRRPSIADPEARRMAESEWRATLEGALLSLDAYWLNHPHANRLARHKPLQLTLAAREGFALPETRITADPAEIRALHRAWDGRMVAKLAGGQLLGPSAEEQYAVYTTLVTEEDLRSAAALAACPAIYQRYLDKDFELRVTVVGDQVFACRIDSPEHADARVDWRRARHSVSLRQFELDGALAARCVALARRLSLDFAGLDLIVTPAGETVFLELNAAGRWAWIEHATGMSIAAAIAERLTGPDARATA
jgi:glutathione synthase/RimK-type ligase-like ATP-grasp enzyme